MKEKDEVKKKKSHRLLKALIAIIIVAGVGVGIYFAISSSGILSKKAPVYKIEIFNGESVANSQQIKENNEIDLSTLHIENY